MSRTSLLKSISQQELEEMLASGMTRMEIANALEVSYATVCRHLPKSKGWDKAAYGSNKTLAKDAKQEPKCAVNKSTLKLLSQIVEYEGKHMRYTVLPEANMVRMTVKPDCTELIALNKTELEVFITELLDILSVISPDRGGDSQ